MTTEVVVSGESKEIQVFHRFCDAIDSHDRLEGRALIATSREERLERVTLYMLRSIEVIDWMVGLLGGLDALNRVIRSNVSGVPKDMQKFDEANRGTA